MTTVDVLLASRGLIDTPEKWTQHWPARDAAGDPVYHLSDDAQSYCMFGATAAVAPLFPDREDAMRALAMTVGVDPDVDFYSAVEWNNAPERTHAEVLAAFDRAIVTAIQQQVADRG